MGLAEKMRRRELVPDFGPGELHPRAGAIAIGLRDFLVAYNLHLATSDVDVAKRIARRLRTAGGGLPAVKALGFFHRERGMAQVSMNLTDFRITSLSDAFDAVARLASESGTEVVSSEIVGLIPEAARVADMRRRLKLMEEPRVLEERMRDEGVPT